MKTLLYLSRLVFVVASGSLFAGCLFKSSTVPVRHFILAPLSTNEAPAASDHLSIGIASVKVPSYLLRNSLAVRNGANEIEYLEGVQWGERLDQCLQRTVAANLSRLLASENVYSMDWARNKVALIVSISVQQYDVDTRGHATLIAHWRISAPDKETLMKNGTARLERTGASPHGNPGAIAVTLSELAADFSRELAQSIREASSGEKK